MSRLLLTLGLLFVAGPCWGAIARVNQGCFANITISGGAITQAIGWTTASGNFFVVQVATPGGILAGTITGATASGTSMTLDAGPVTDVVSTALLRLANTGSVSSVTITITGNNGGAASFCAAEYSGVSLTATPVNTAVTGMSGFESSTNTWTNGSYTAAAGNLVLSGAAATLNGQTWGAGSGWTMVGSDDSVSSAGLMLEEQLNVGAGGFVGTGTLTMVTTFGTRFVYYTVSYPAVSAGAGGGGFGGVGGIGGKGGVGD
jgi:hypothetical protein